VDPSGLSFFDKLNGFAQGFLNTLTQTVTTYIDTSPVNQVKNAYNTVTGAVDMVKDVASSTKSVYNSVKNKTLKSDIKTSVDALSDGYNNLSDYEQGEMFGTVTAIAAETAVAVVVGSAITTKVPASMDARWMSPKELVPTETPGLNKVIRYQSSMERRGFFTDHPILYYESDGVKYIVDGHHRVQAAINAGINVYAQPVTEELFMTRWGGTANDFMAKVNNFINK